MSRPKWINEATRRARVGQSALYIANIMGLPYATATRLVRPINQRRQQHARRTRTSE